MARRSRSKLNPAVIIIALVLIVGAIVGAVFFTGQSGEPYRKYEKLDVNAYLENSNSLRGNVYQVEGEVMNDLAWSPSEGRLFSFGVDNNSQIIAILIPVSLNSLNIQKGQHFTVLLEVTDNGMLRARSMTKT